MNKQFNLSEKMIPSYGYDDDTLVIHPDYAKEFIQRLFDGLDRDYENGDIEMSQYHRRREEIIKLAGDKLINNCPGQHKTAQMGCGKEETTERKGNRDEIDKDYDGKGLWGCNNCGWSNSPKNTQCRKCTQPREKIK